MGLTPWPNGGCCSSSSWVSSCSTSSPVAPIILFNEFARRTKAGGIITFFVIPVILTVYFVAIAIGARSGAEWAVNNQTHVYMNGWFHYAKLYAALTGCIGFMMIKYKWGIGAKHWFKPFPFIIVAINILIAVASDFESAIMGWNKWWLSSEGVWLYGGWHNVMNGVAGLLEQVVALQRGRLALWRLAQRHERRRRSAQHPLYDRLVECVPVQGQERHDLGRHDLGLHRGL